MQPGAWSGQDTIEELLVRHCADAGDRVAFADARRSVTYSELLAKTAAVASRLRSLGVGRGDRVIVRLGNTVEFVEYCLGVTRAAAVGVPVSPRATEAELAYLIEDSGAVALVTQHDQLARDREGLRVVGVDDAALEPGTPIPDVLGPDEPAWLLYTSGTSGEPKGVLSTQRSALWAAATGFGEVLGLDGNDTVLWPLPMHHSFSHSMALLGNLVTGACTRIVADGAGPKALSELLARHPGAVLAGVPATYAQLVQQGRTAAPRFCLSAGAVMPDALRHAVEDTFQAPLIDGYGSTETCGLIAVQRPGEPRVVGSCGTPLPGVAVRVVEGELLVRTPGLMLGYHGRPQETANALADGWFRTGDSGRIDDSGLVTVTGRMDEILVCGGENVHPTEIEQVLLTIPSVQDVIVVGRPHEILGEVPVALVIPGPNGFDPIELRQACAARLPEYKVPVDFLAVTAIARTASGKPLRRLMAGAAQIDMAARRAELRELPAVRRRTALNDLVRTETLAAYGRAAERGWAPGQPFADAGLSSLGAVLLRTRLSDRTGLPLPETLAYDFPTPAAVVGHLDSLLSGAVADTPVPATKPVDPDPVVIVSMACRYPGGVRSPADLWRLVNGETDAIGDFPTDRGWDMARLYDPDPDRIGRTYVLRGGFLDDPASFDAGLFGMSPREALATDPQQRLLLETAWEALERAGIDAATLRGSDTGVFVGVMYDDYAGRFTEHELEAQLGIGSAHSVASGRISYVFDFVGPTLSVDTACSSSLVALHLAVRALRAGECSLAMVGGATVLATPNPFVAFSRQRGLSPSGVCRSYADGADGTVWAEGVGLLLLEKLSDAHRNGHPVLATIRGSAVNSDGASNGLTAPNGEAQQRLVRSALADAGLHAADVDVVEGHGTATPLGDPIEIGALLATYGRHRSPERPLLLGSVKSHLGHTQAAAGVAGVMKMVEALQHELLPRSLHAEEPTSRVDWSAGEVSLLTAPAPWPRCARPRRAGVSSFGIGGTNAHVILEEAPELPAATGDRGLLAVPWLLSAANAAALRALAAGLAGDSHDPLDVAYTLSTGRTPLAVRAVVPAGDRTALAELAAGRQSGSVVPPDARLALLFSGQGAQRPAMGADLARIFPVFADRFDEACAALDRHLGTSVRDVAFAAESPLLDRTDFTQAALFAFEVALYRLVESWGVQPVMLAGHSIGELAAAHVAGVLSLADAATLVAARGRLMAGLPTGGAMFAVEAAEHEVLPLVAMAPTEISVAAVNGPLSIVVSGEENAARAVADEFAGRGRRTSRLRVSHAFHSPLIDPMLGEFRAVADSLSYATPRIDIVSGVLGRRATPAELCSPGYWVDHARQAIRFGDALTALRDANVTMALEIGPDTTLARLASVTLPAVAATRTAEPESTALLAAMGALWASGHSVDWPAVFAGSGARTVPLPTYPFQRRRYWLDPPTPGDDNAHPLLGAALPAPDSGRIVHGGSVSVRTQHWLTDHVVGDTVVVPGAALVEIMLQAGIEAGVPHLREATMVAPLVLASDMQLQVTLGEAGSGERQVDLYARQGTEPWTCHASGILGGAKPAPPPDDEPWPPPAAEPVDLDGRYARLAEVGLRYGPAFRAVTATWRRGDEVFAEVRLPPGVSGRFGVHPVLLDAAVHASALVHADGDALHVPYAWCGVEIHATGATRIRVRCVRVGPDEIAVDLRDESGRPVATVGSMRTRPAGPHIPNVVRRGLFRPYWTPVTTSPGQRTGWTVTGDDVFGLADILPRDGTRPGHVLQVAGTDGEHVPGAVRARTADVLEGLQSWQRTAEGARLLVVTAGATGSRPDLAAAAVLGLVGSAQAEHPELITLVDIDASPASRRALPAAVDGNEPRLSIRDGIVYRQRLVRAAPAASSPEFGGGTVLVTGGTGALGALVARHLVADLVVRHVVLLSRRGPDAPGAERLGTELRDLGATVRIVAGDAADRATVEEIVATCEPALTGIVHTAGVIDAGILSSLDNDRLARVLAPKVDAAWTLHEATAHLQLTRFVLFSSISGVLGQAGQANYAAANTCLDALAVHRRALGLPALSLAWGPWEHGGGMAGDLPATVRRRMTATGLTAMTDEEGLALFDAALDAREPVLVPALLGPPTSDVPPLLADLVPRRTPLRIRAAEGTWRQLFVGLDAAERRHRLTELVRAELADILGYTEPAEFPLDEPFSTLGFDSLAATLARGRLAERCGLPLPVTVLFDHPTCTDLATHLDTALGTERRP